MAKSKKSKSNGISVTTVLIAGATGYLFFVAPATCVLLFIGMAPTLASWLSISKRDHRLKVPTVFAYNLTGVLPFVVGHWQGGGGFDPLMAILTDVFSLVVMYGAAAIGLLSLWMAPQLAVFFIQVRSKERNKAVIREQSKLAEEWHLDKSAK